MRNNSIVAISEEKNKYDRLRRKKGGLRFDMKEPLNKEDTPDQTYGCRQRDPDSCSRCMLPDICAFTSEDKICKSPSKNWKKQYYVLKENS